MGSNLSGCFGSPSDTLRIAVDRLTARGVDVVGQSRQFKTRPVGGGWQPDFVNAALLVRTNKSPRELLRIAKVIEREAGRRPGRRWGPRALDIDIIDYGGRLFPASGQGVSTAPVLGGLILPHPRAHLRAFVLIPIEELNHRWRHPRLGVSVRQLLGSLTKADQRAVRPVTPARHSSAR